MDDPRSPAGTAGRVTAWVARNLKSFGIFVLTLFLMALIHELLAPAVRQLVGQNLAVNLAELAGASVIAFILAKNSRP